MDFGTSGWTRIGPAPAITAWAVAAGRVATGQTDDECKAEGGTAGGGAGPNKQHGVEQTTQGGADGEKATVPNNQSRAEHTT